MRPHLVVVLQAPPVRSATVVRLHPRDVLVRATIAPIAVLVKVLRAPIGVVIVLIDIARNKARGKDIDIVNLVVRVLRVIVRRSELN